MAGTSAEGPASAQGPASAASPGGGSLSPVPTEDPSRAPSVRVALQRRLGGGLLEAASFLRWVPRKLMRPPPPSRRFLIFGRGRSGSTLLVSLLDNHPSISCAGEVLRYRTLMPGAHLRRCLDLSKAPVSGCKLLSYQMRTIHGMGPDTDFLRRLADDGITILYLTRENLVRHAISNILARRRRVYHQSGGATADLRISIDPDEILTWIGGSEQLGEYERAVLEGVPHEAITYESHLASPEAREATYARLVAGFGQDFVPPRSNLSKVTPENLRSLLVNYSELVAALAGTRYAGFLNETSAS